MDCTDQELQVTKGVTSDGPLALVGVKVARELFLWIQNISIHYRAS